MREHEDESRRRDSAATGRYDEESRKLESASYTQSSNDADWERMTSKDPEVTHETHMFDIDRMVNEGLGGGNITADNGYIGDSTTDAMVPEVRSDEDA